VMRTRSGTAMTLIPWGPVALWGPLDEIVARPEEGFQAEAGTIELLLDELNEYSSHRYSADEIVSMRAGVRPLAIPREFGRETPPVEELSRRSHIYRDPSLPWISVYGGKLTNCMALAEAAAGQVRAVAAPSGETGQQTITQLRPSMFPELASFPGLSAAVPSARWCRSHEMCWTLEDYLRRRTNIAQWIPNAGFGRRWENSAELRRLAAVFADNEAAADRALKGYARKVERDTRALTQGMRALEEVNP
jgi:glycerol-3-phosphate dehydrogenase